MTHFLDRRLSAREWRCEELVQRDGRCCCLSGEEWGESRIRKGIFNFNLKIVFILDTYSYYKSKKCWKSLFCIMGDNFDVFFSNSSSFPFQCRRSKRILPILSWKNCNKMNILNSDGRIRDRVGLRERAFDRGRWRGEVRVAVWNKKPIKDREAAAKWRVILRKSV